MITLSLVKRYALMTIIIFCIVLSSCGNNNIVDVEGAPSITEQEYALQVSNALLAHNFFARRLGTQPPLDPPRFVACQKITLAVQPQIGKDTLYQSCSFAYQQLKTETLNKLIFSRWALSKSNPLRIKPLTPAQAKSVAKAQLSLTFPNSADQKNFFKNTKLDLSALSESAKMDADIWHVQHQDRGYKPQPTINELDQLIASDKSLRSLPIVAARTRAATILTKANTQAAFLQADLVSIRKITKCAGTVTSALCGNRPAAIEGALTSTGNPLIFQGPGYNRNLDSLLDSASGIARRQKGFHWEEDSPLPPPLIDTSGFYNDRRN